MKTKFLMYLPLMAALAIFTACGGGGGGSSGGESGGGETGGGTGVASVDTLSSIPTVDLSQYDSSTSSANVAVAPSKSVGLSKAFGENMSAVGGASRAGCEQNMHKKEVFRMSQMAQLDRCFPEAMESVGLISAIPTGSYAFYRIAPPDMGDEQGTAMCDGIPTERTDERAACLAEASQRGTKRILLRLGKIDSALHIDMCEGDPGSQVNSATYSASGSLYTASLQRIGTFGGRTESGAFSMSVDIGSTGTITNGVVTIGDSGFVTAAGQMNGGFGSGSIAFERDVNSAVGIRGAFTGGFDDPFSGTRTEFTGRTFSRVGGSPVTGCAKFSFGGTMPAFRVVDMIPFDIGADQLEGFLSTFGAQLGIAITASNYQTLKLCPNPDFDPGNFDPTIKPMVALAEGAANCPSVTHTGIECFSVTNSTITSDFGSRVTQAFTIIANAAAPQYAEVNAFDLSSLSPTIGTIAFERTWDCSGSFSDVNFAAVTPAAMETAMSRCFALEEKARGEDGMGGYNCGEQQQMNDVNEMADGGGGADAFGTYGGEYQLTVGGSCPNDQIPAQLFANKIDDDTYCLPLPSEGRCAEFDIVNNLAVPSPAIEIGGGATITQFDFAVAPDPPGVTITFSRNDLPCDGDYLINRPSFTGGGSFGSGGGGQAPGEGGYVPQPCIDAGLTGPEDAEACGQLCQQPGTDCR